MSPHLELKSFTEFDPHELGGDLYRIVSHPANQILRREFPALGRFYGSATVAVQTVAKRQHSITTEAYEVTAIVGSGRVIGVQSFMATEVPRTDETGVNLAIWLDMTREAELRRIGVPLMHLRMERLIGDTRFDGRPWTVIRPKNRPSMRTWQYRGYPWGEFRAVGSAARYTKIDGVTKRRQLFVCPKTLTELR